MGSDANILLNQITGRYFIFRVVIQEILGFYRKLVRHQIEFQTIQVLDFYLTFITKVSNCKTLIKKAQRYLRPINDSWGVAETYINEMEKQQGAFLRKF